MSEVFQLVHVLYFILMVAAGVFAAVCSWNKLGPFGIGFGAVVSFVAAGALLPLVVPEERKKWKPLEAITFYGFIGLEAALLWWGAGFWVHVAVVLVVPTVCSSLWTVSLRDLVNVGFCLGVGIAVVLYRWQEDGILVALFLGAISFFACAFAVLSGEDDSGIRRGRDVLR